MERRPKIAVLILAHKNLHQVMRLVRVLEHDDVQCFIHADKKWVLTADEFRLWKVAESEGVQFCDNRISARLDEWSLIEATVELIKEAKKFSERTSIQFRYFALLSGQDFLLKPVASFVKCLVESYPKPFIDCTPVHKKNWVIRKFNNFPAYHSFNAWVNQRMPPGRIRQLLKSPVYMMFRIGSLFFATPEAKLAKQKCSLFGGSAWWVLPDRVIEDVLNLVDDEGSSLLRALKSVRTPEETFFQIVTMRSRCSDLVEINPLHSRKQNCLTYAHFEAPGKPFNWHPYILTIDDKEFLLSLKEFFARKFDSTVDGRIVEFLENHLLDQAKKGDVNSSLVGKEIFVMG